MGTLQSHNAPPGATIDAAAGQADRFNMAATAPAATDLDQVLQGVEHISKGIDAMLMAASTSSIAACPPPPPSVLAPVTQDTLASSAETDDATSEGDDAEIDDDMMCVFDEDAPSDIHAIDRLLARQAEDATTATEDWAEPDEAGPDTLAIGVRSTRDRRATDHHGQDSDVLAVIGEPAFDADHHASVPDAHATAPAHGTGSPLDTRLAGDFTVVEDETAGHRQTEPPTPAIGLASPLATAVAHRSIDAVAAAAPTTDPTAAPRTLSRRRINPIVTVRSTIVQTLSLINLPLAALPPSARPTVNVLAFTLALWAPAVWLMAPTLAERAAAAAAARLAAGDEPSHGESALHESEASESPSHAPADSHH